jgi:Methyltransferase domain
MTSQKAITNISQWKHSCPKSVSAGAVVRMVQYPDRSIWQLEGGKSLELDIRYCPYCGDQLASTLSIPTAMTPNERSKLQDLAQGLNVLEIGSLFGYSTIALAEVANVVWAVDPHEGYPQADPRGTIKQFLANINSAGVRDKIIPVLSHGQRVIDRLPKDYFGLVFIDCTRDAKELIHKAAELRPTYLVLHDYGHDEWTGATEAVKLFMHSSGRLLEVVDTLAILYWPWIDGPE